MKYWRNKRDKLVKKYSYVSDRDLKYTIGKEKEMMEKLREKLGKSEEEILGIIIDL
jgi:hypothetical protein